MGPLLRLLAATAAFVLVAAAPAAAANPWLARTDLNIAHQGGEIEAPSDTMYAFRTAVEKGADVLEMDVHLAADNQIVVLHDATVDRTTNGSGPVEAMSVAQIKQFDAAHWFVPDRGTTHSAAPSEYTLRGIATGAKAPPAGFTANDFKIPTLEEVLRAFPGVLLNIELKPTVAKSGQLELATARLLKQFNRVSDVIVVSFNDQSVELFKLFAPNVHTAVATGQAALFYASAFGTSPGLPNPRYVALQVPEVFGGVPVTSPDFVADANRNGFAVHVWTINDEPTMRKLLGFGVQGIMTDRPTLLERILDEG